MISKIAPTFPNVIWMGFIIVILSVVIGFVNSQTAAAYFAKSKAVRETTLMAERAAVESTKLWLPYFKFLGLGMVLGGIMMAFLFTSITVALTVIIGTLRMQTKLLSALIQKAG